MAEPAQRRDQVRPTSSISIPRVLPALGADIPLGARSHRHPPATSRFNSEINSCHESRVLDSTGRVKDCPLLWLSLRHLRILLLCSYGLLCEKIRLLSGGDEPPPKARSKRPHLSATATCISGVVPTCSAARSLRAPGYRMIAMSRPSQSPSSTAHRNRHL